MYVCITVCIHVHILHITVHMCILLYVGTYALCQVSIVCHCMYPCYVYTYIHTYIYSYVCEKVIFHIYIVYQYQQVLRDKYKQHVEENGFSHFEALVKEVSSLKVEVAALKESNKQNRATGGRTTSPLNDVQSSGLLNTVESLVQVCSTYVYIYHHCRYLY